MEDSPQRHTQSSNQTGRSPSSQQRNMAMLTAPVTSPLSFSNDHYWSAGNRSPQWRGNNDHDSSKTSVSLPSIRMTFPELQLPSIAQDSSNPPQSSSGTSPRSTAPGQLTSPDYVHSPGANKRRRNSYEDEQERERARQVPRLYRSPRDHRRPSPERAPPVRQDSWPYPTRRSPAPSRENPPQQQPIVDMNDLSGARQSLSSLPNNNGQGMSQPPQSARQYRSNLGDGYPDPRTRPPPTFSYEPSPYQPQGPTEGSSTAPYPDYAYRPVPHGMASHHSSYDHNAPYLGGSEHGAHRQANPYPAYDSYCARFPDIGMTIDKTQRKRRGNLPKETTDKLRAWFMAHLAHPYPTEDEKQDLMRQTGLQMNQISNWFINARRRQLPTMINNAQVETNATSSTPASRSADGNVAQIPPQAAERDWRTTHTNAPPHHAYQRYHELHGKHFSGDGEAQLGIQRGYDDDVERRAAASRERGSI